MRYKTLLTLIYGETRDRKRSASWVVFSTNKPNYIVLYLAAGKLPFSRILPLKELMLNDIRKMLAAKGYVESVKRDQVYTFNKGTHEIHIILLGGNAWGTIEETYLLIKHLLLDYRETIHVFSSRSHLPRIKRIWALFAPEWNVECISADEDMSDNLKSFESKKDTQTTVFYWVYRHFGETGFHIISYLKNLIVNRILNLQGE